MVPHINAAQVWYSCYFTEFESNQTSSDSLITADYIISAMPSLIGETSLPGLPGVAVFADGLVGLVEFSMVMARTVLGGDTSVFLSQEGNNITSDP